MYGFRIELQTNLDAIDNDGNIEKLQKLVITTNKNGLEKDLSVLFGKQISCIETTLGNPTSIKQAIFTATPQTILKDPNVVEICI